jgi:hypothetical protein
MTAVPAPLPDHRGESLLDRLLNAVRPEFQGEIIRIDVDDPVFARGRCEVDGCERGAWTRLLCNSHYNRWRLQGRADISSFTATTGPLRPKPGFELVDAFDLRALPVQARLEIAYSIQRRHDDRTVRLLPTMISGLVKVVAAAKVDSLFDRSLNDWLAAVNALADSGGRTVGQLRYAWRHLHDLADGADAETEFARDIWRASVLGVSQSRSPHQIRFDGITQT